ncbi:MAG: hypothetical protein D6696_05465 [Acidobacteria bacterium]|nr:MAG: hypothetical protein D6696_05465 [Acidobacteriota bacterium]
MRAIPKGIVLTAGLILSTLAAGGAFAAGGEPAADLSTRTDGSDWPTFLGPNRDGKSTETGIRKDWSDGLPIRWQMEVGEGYSAPSVARGRLFVFDRVGDSARLTAVHSETGEVLWRREYPTHYEDMYNYSGGPRAAPVIDDGRVYAYGVEGRLRCHRAADGELLWEVDVARTYGVKQNFFGVGSTPIVDRDLLIVPVGGSPPDSPGIQSGEVVPNGTAIVAFDKASGEERYRVGDELSSYSSPLVRTIDGRRLGLYFARGGLLAFDAAGGELAFHFPWRAKKLESVNAATPVVVGDRIFLTESYGPGGVLLEVAGGKPRVVWQDPRRDQAMACHWSTPIHHRGILYGSSGQSSGDAELRAVELGTGKVRWSKPGLRRSTLIYADGHLVVLGEYGELWLVEATPERFHLVTETVLKEGDRPLLQHPAWNAPVLAHGLLYLRGKDRLVAVELIPPPARPKLEESPAPSSRPQPGDAPRLPVSRRAPSPPAPGG